MEHCKGVAAPTEDPSALTTKQLHREIAVLKEIFDSRNHSTDGLIKLLQSAEEKIPATIKGELDNLKQLHDERFNSVQTQFRERDTRTDQQSKEGKEAIQAALQAAKEAVGKQQEASDKAIAKSEFSTIKQIDQINITIQAIGDNLNDKIQGVQARQLVLEGRQTGVKETKDDGKSNLAIIISIVSVLLMVGSSIYGAVRQAPAAPQIVYVPAPIKAVP